MKVKDKGDATERSFASPRLDPDSARRTGAYRRPGPDQGTEDGREHEPTEAIGEVRLASGDSSERAEAQARGGQVATQARLDATIAMLRHAVPLLQVLQQRATAEKAQVS
jgi:hypothetical protein